MERLRAMKEAEPEIFAAAIKELPETLVSLEARLGVSLPEPVRWFWLECGSGLSSAAPSAAMSIEATERFRRAAGLPAQFLVLDERGDAGAVLLDTASEAGAVRWVDTHAAHRLATGELARHEYDQYSAFSDWVAYCVGEARDAL